jgi:hypothetical protein
VQGAKASWRRSLRSAYGVQAYSAVVEDELKAAGFTHVRTIPKWPEGDKYPLFLVLFRKP